MMLEFAQMIPPAVIMAGVAFYARLKSFDKATIFLLLLAFALYYFHFYHTNWTEFSIDPGPHMDYVNFLLNTHRLPVPGDNLGAAARHPPAFYIASATLLQLGQWLGLSDPVQFARNMAMAFFAVFIVMSTGLLRFVINENTGAFYSALLLLLFWPIGTTMGGRVSCDILLFAGQAGTLFALVRWQAARTPASLCAPFLWGGISVLGKNGGVLMIVFTGVAFLFTLWKYLLPASEVTPDGAQARRQFTVRNLKAFLRWDLFLSIAFALTCATLSYRHGWILRHIEDYGYYGKFLWNMIDSFNPFLFIYDMSLGLSQDSFWNMWLHTLLLGGGAITWKSQDMMLISTVLWLALLFYGVNGLLTARKKLSPLEKSSMTLLTVFVVLMILAALYLLMRTANPNYTDARYSYPAILIFTLMHGIVMKHHRQAGRKRAYRIGEWLALSFACVTFMLLGFQYLA